MAKILLIDGYSILHRAFYGIAPLTNAEGLHTNALYGFLNILFKYTEEEQPDTLAVALDVHAPTFRHELYKAYKGTRRPMPEELKEQLPYLRKLLLAMQIPYVEQEGLEADDILGTLSAKAEKEGHEVTVLSGDRDLLQLATEKVLIRLIKTKGGQTVSENYHAQEVLEAYGVSPKEFISVKALMGDASDNIPGVPGIGEKTAVKLIAAYHSLPNLMAHLSEVTPPKAKKALSEHGEHLSLWQTLVTIKTDAPLSFSFAEKGAGDFYNENAYALFKKLGFKRFLDRFAKEDGGKEKEEQLSVFTGEEEMLSYLQSLPEKLSVGFSLEGEGGNFCIGLFTEGKGAALYPENGVWKGPLKEAFIRVLQNAESAVTFKLKDAILKMPALGELAIEDAALGAYLLNPLQSEPAFDDIAEKFLAKALPSEKELLGKASVKEALMHQPEAAFRLALLKAQAAYEAMPLIKEELIKEGMEELYRKIELPLTRVLASMESVGVRVQRDALAAYGKKLQEGIDTLEEKIYAQAGETFNIQSPKQLGVILFEKMGLPAGKKTKTGYSTAAQVLEKLALEYPFVADILSYRQLTKLKSTYADGLASFIGEDERIHGRFHQMITATGRISSTDPNLQNIPVRMALGREIRKVFVPKEGFTFIDADYSQIELRIMAHFSGDEKLIAAYRENKDIHKMTASKVFHVPIDEVTSLERRNAKAVNFGIIYGISGFGLSQGLSISRKEAEDYINAYFQSFPGVKAYLDKTVEAAKKEKKVRTLFGRIRPMPELADANFMRRQFGERVAMNAPIQGTAADIMKIAMIAVWEAMERENLQSHIVLQVHDELLIEAALEEKERVMEILRESMQGAAKLLVPLEVDIGVGHNWLEAK